jgi:uncharacterized membrane protein
LDAAVTFNRNDLAAGAIFVAIGVAFGAESILSLPVGSALRMGPGYFPLVLAGLLVLAGVAIALRSIGNDAARNAPIPWRGLVVLLPAPIVFGATIRGLGLVAAVALVVLISAFASRRASPQLAVLLAVGLTVFCVGVFHYGLGLPIRLFGPWTGPLSRFG